MISQIANNNKSVSPMAPRKKYPAPQPVVSRSIQELKQKYEQQSSEPTKIVKAKYPKLRQSSMVKQMASLFNNKISQFIRRDPEVISKVEEPKALPRNILPKPLPMPRVRHNKDKAPVPSPRTKSKSKIQKKAICFVAEDAFAKLTVKDKALLYTKFVDDMSRKNPKFGKHAQLIETIVEKEVVRGEVVNEKQESVKQLLLNIEARCVFPKQIISKGAIQKSSAVKVTSRRNLIKAKEFEDITLDQSRANEKKSPRSQSLPRSQISAAIPKALPTFATPKEIRRNRAELLAPQQCLQNQQLEHLFYSWLKQRHEHEESQQSNQSELDEEKQKSAIDRLLEEAIAKLETVEIKQKEESLKETMNKALVAVQSLDSTPKITPRKKYRAPAVPQPQSIKTETVGSESGTSTTTSAKQSEADESESGISNLTKTTSDEDQTENKEKPQPSSTKELEKPVRPLRKKKMRRTLSWKKDSSLVETKPISSTDSESDCKQERPLNKKPSNKPQPLDLKAITNDMPAEPSFVELDKSLMRVVNSPRKIKSAYTLTVFSPPASNEESLNDMESSLNKTQDCCSRSWSSLIEGQQEQESAKGQPRSLADSFDQGFETGSNDIDSPMKPQRKSSLKRQSSIDRSQKMPENPSGFSTPVKGKGQQNFNHSSNGSQQQLFSPISVPLKNRRRSIYDNESRRSSIAMQVIREDQPLEHHEIQSPRSLSNTDAFFANAPTMDMTSDMTGVNQQKTSSFWIKSGDFSITLDIHRNEKERIKLLYEIFSQRSCDSKDMHFGIDEQKFSVHDYATEHNNSLRLPHLEGASQYWFSTGDLAIPFSGKLLSAGKIQRLFQFIKSSVEETGILRFGVDDVEFSNVPELWGQDPKFSMESNYSMLVGLQSGNSNGLEGRSKYAWPHSKPVPVSDLDQSDFEGDDFEQENESVRLSFSPFASKHFDLACLDTEDLMMPRQSAAMMMSPETFCMGYENESLDQLFEKNQDKEQKVEKVADSSTGEAKIPEMLNTLQVQQERLTSVQERMSSYHNPANLSCDSLDALKGSPEYLVQLKTIISDISKIGCSDGFKDCSLQQLERYMFFLSRYTDICLNSCSSHMDKILDALLDHRSEEV